MEKTDARYTLPVGFKHIVNNRLVVDSSSLNGDDSYIRVVCWSRSLRMTFVIIFGKDIKRKSHFITCRIPSNTKMRLCV